MAESYNPLAPDSRTFALLQARVLDDINRPDLQSIVAQYIQDAIRYYQRKPFFFNDADNTTVPTWTANTFYPQGATIEAIATPPLPALPFAIAAVNLTAGLSDPATTPVFDPNLFVVPTNLTSPPIYAPGPGTVVDNQCLWATAATWTNGIWTQLSTVPFQNQYVPPIDYIAPRRVEMTWSGNLRIGMTWMNYDELRDLDVIRPTPPNTYSSWWTWYQQQLYFWPYPVGFYPITLSYRTAPPLLVNATDSNFWSTSAERLIRTYACGLISEGVIGDSEAAQRYYALSQQELNALISHRIAQEQPGEGGGIPATAW